MKCAKCGSELVWDNNQYYVGWWCETCQGPKCEELNEVIDAREQVILNCSRELASMVELHIFEIPEFNCKHGSPGGCVYRIKKWEDLPFFICYTCEYHQMISSDAKPDKKDFNTEKTGESSQRLGSRRLL